MSNAIDRSTFDQLRELESMGKSPFLDDLIGNFLKDTPERGDRIRTAVKLGDARTLEAMAHSLRSSSAFLGAYGLSAIYERLEAAGAVEDMAIARGLLVELEAEFERVKRELEELRGRGPLAASTTLRSSRRA